LKEIHDMMDFNWEICINDDEILKKFWWWEEKIYKSCYIGVTLPIVYSLFLRSPDIRWFLDSINIWWDTDSNWAIMGNMIWAYMGKFYPNKFDEKLQDVDRIKERVKIFSDLFIDS
jgi:hypothetical protein